MQSALCGCDQNIGYSFCHRSRFHAMVEHPVYIDLIHSKQFYCAYGHPPIRLFVAWFELCLWALSHRRLFCCAVRAVLMDARPSAPFLLRGDCCKCTQPPPKESKKRQSFCGTGNAKPSGTYTSKGRMKRRYGYGGILCMDLRTGFSGGVYLQWRIVSQTPVTGGGKRLPEAVCRRGS